MMPTLYEVSFSTPPPDLSAALLSLEFHSSQLKPVIS
jgi:hypothetical protein